MVIISFLLAFLGGGAVSTFAHASDVGPHVIYGPDNRKDFYQVSDSSLRRIADSTPALFKLEDLQISGDRTRITAKTYAEYEHLCPDQPFRDQLTGAFCSGALVAPDLVLTAGHCVDSEQGCAETAFGFDYRVSNPNASVDSLATRDVYLCKKIVARKFFSAGRDFALIRLDRPVTDRTPLPMHLTGDVSLDAQLAVFGYPTGLPLKIADGARIRELKKEFFLTDTDTFGGNSGSPVINLKTLEIEGVLVRGDTDFEEDTKRKCSIERRCPQDGCTGESATFASSARKAFQSKITVPSIEEGSAFADAYGGNGRLDIKLRVPALPAGAAVTIEFSAWSAELKDFEKVSTFAVGQLRPDQQEASHFNFTLPDSSMLSWGFCRGRLVLKIAGEAVDEEFISIQAME